MQLYSSDRSIFKKLEYLFKEFRSYINPKAYATFLKYNRTGLNLPSEISPCAVFDIKSIDVDYVGGRYFYYLVQDTIAAGYHPVFKNNFRFIATLPYKKFKKLLLKDSFGVANGRDQFPDGSLYFCDHRFPEVNVEKFIKISFEERLPESSSEYQLPFGFFPSLLKTETELLALNTNSTRQKRVFFGGKATVAHDRPEIRKKYSIILRYDVILEIERAIKDSRLPSEHVHLHYKDEDYIPPDKWMATMANSDFFLALPGISMPMCHNLVEALAMGAIPILQYSDYLNPPLQDKVNCLTYRDEESLIRVIQEAITMSASDKHKMSAAAIQYYLNHLKLGQFTAEMVSNPSTELTLFINANRVPRVQ